MKAARPDLIATIESAAKEAAKTENAKAIAALVAEKTGEIETKLRAELKLEKGKKSADEEDDDEDMKEMIVAAARHGLHVVSDATKPGGERYGGGKGARAKARKSPKVRTPSLRKTATDQANRKFARGSRSTT